MRRLDLQPQSLKKELKRFNSRLLQSYQTLNNLGDLGIEATVYSEVFQQDKLRLRYYAPPDINPELSPILICYALVNRPSMLDLHPERSLIAQLLAAGFRVYLIDWGYPDASDRYLDLDDYINGYLHQCVLFSCEHSQSPKITLMGICQGGTFSLCYTALHPQKVERLITLVTPVDFSTPDFTLSRLVKHLDIDLTVNTYGNIPGQRLNDLYTSLMPMRLSLQKQMDLPSILSEPQKALEFLRMEHWLNDCPDQAGEAFRQFAIWFFQENRLIQGQLTLAGQKVDLKAITQPLLNIFGLQDHLVPPSASRALAQHTASQNYQELALRTGHIGLFVSKRNGTQVADAITHWCCAT